MGTRIELDAKQLTVDGRTRIAIEQAKKAAAKHRFSGCFGHRGGITKDEVAQGMWLAQETRNAEYM